MDGWVYLKIFRCRIINVTNILSSRNIIYCQLLFNLNSVLNPNKIPTIRKLLPHKILKQFHYPRHASPSAIANPLSTRELWKLPSKKDSPAKYSDLVPRIEGEEESRFPVGKKKGSRRISWPVVEHRRPVEHLLRAPRKLHSAVFLLHIRTECSSDKERIVATGVGEDTVRGVNQI